jgi:chitin disaccharide deacetylase
VPIETKSSVNCGPVVRPGLQGRSEAHAGALIINADDWGRDAETTDRILECAVLGAVSSTSAMVFMEDSERGAALAQEHQIDAGLHLNLTTPFTAVRTPAQLVEHQSRVSRYLRAHRLAQAVFNPWLAGSFEYVVAAQIEEFHRLYGAVPDRIDGHHHMHLCANVLLQKLLPTGTIVRRNFSFRLGEKSRLNLFYRHLQDRRLEKRHRLADFFFSLPPVEPVDRLRRIFALAQHAVVELETHPVNPEEYQFLTSGKMFQELSDLQVAPGFTASVCTRVISGQTVRSRS